MGRQGRQIFRVGGLLLGIGASLSLSCASSCPASTGALDAGAGRTETDAGQNLEDAGALPLDAGTFPDAGDAGAARDDGGDALDGGLPPLLDAGEPESDGGPGPLLDGSILLDGGGSDGGTDGGVDGGGMGFADGGADGGADLGRWEELAPLPTPRQETAVVAVGETIYVIGGYDDTPVMQDRVDVYDVALDAWAVAPDLPRPLHHANAAASGGVIYVAGFLIDSFREDGRVFSLAPGATSWATETSMPAGTERGAGAAVAIDEKIYVVGGYRAFAAVADFSVYDTQADTWSALPDLPEALDHLVAGAIGGSLYVAGGRNGSIAGHIPRSFSFDPAAGAWVELSPMPTSRAGIAGAVVSERLYVFGGEGAVGVPGGVFDDVERYDPATGAWEILAPMALPRHGMGAVGLADRAYVPGGADVQAFAAVAHFDAFLPPP